MTTPLLAISDFKVSYGRVAVVQGVSISVSPGEIFALVGANGAGKTTLLSGIMGLLPTRGEALFAGKSMQRSSTEVRVIEGLSLVPERRELFSTMSVEDNLRTAAFRLHKNQVSEQLNDIFSRFPRLRERRAQQAGTLSGGERQMLAMGRALMTVPRILMLDEPSLGLAPKIVAEVFRTIVELSGSGVAVLLVEQNARAALRIAHRACVMELGRIVIEGEASKLAEDPKVVEVYLGGGKHNELINEERK